MGEESHLGRLLRRLAGGTGETGQLPIPDIALPVPLEMAVTESAAEKRRNVRLVPGQKMKHFTVQRELGRGAMAAVYLARDERDGRLVALKVLSLSDDWPEDRLDEARLRLLREYEASERIQHPDIVEVYEAGEADGRVFLAMEYVEGVNLATHVAPGKLLPARMVTEMCARVADALQYAHRRGVVHRDIKPANIVFDQRTRRVRLMDLGVARLADSGATRTGIILGSPSYMSPEQLEARKITGSSDLFSLGVTLFQLLTGTLPFRADSITGLMQKIATTPHPPIKALRPEYPDCLDRVLDRALAKRPDDRYATATEMAVALRDCGRQIPPGLR